MVSTNTYTKVFLLLYCNGCVVIIFIVNLTILLIFIFNFLF